MLVDSHCHLDCLSQEQGSIAEVLTRAKQEGVGHFLCVGITQATFPAMLAAIEEFPNVFASVGTHPNEPAQQEPSVDEMINFAKHSKVVAIGETGLDYYRLDDQSPTQQQMRFRNHIKAAHAVNKPLIIHSRQAREDTIQILKEENAQAVRGVMHCFTENWEMAQQAIALDFYISFSGIITFKNAQDIRDVVEQVPLERLLIETDAPYLAPVPYRGKSNEPAYVRYVAEKVAEIKQLSYEAVAKQTTQNFFDLFGRNENINS